MAAAAPAACASLRAGVASWRAPRARRYGACRSAGSQQGEQASSTPLDVLRNDLHYLEGLDMAAREAHDEVGTLWLLPVLPAPGACSAHASITVASVLFHDLSPMRLSVPCSAKPRDSAALVSCQVHASSVPHLMNPLCSLNLLPPSALLGHGWQRHAHMIQARVLAGCQHVLRSVPAPCRPAAASAPCGVCPGARRWWRCSTPLPARR